MVNQLVQDIVKTACVKLAGLGGFKEFINHGLYKDLANPGSREILLDELVTNIFSKDLLKSTAIGTGIGAGAGGLYGAIKGYRSSTGDFKSKLKQALSDAKSKGLKGGLVGGGLGASYGILDAADTTAHTYTRRAKESLDPWIFYQRRANDITAIRDKYFKLEPEAANKFEKSIEDFMQVAKRNNKVTDEFLGGLREIFDEVVPSVVGQYEVHTLNPYKLLWHPGPDNGSTLFGHHLLNDKDLNDVLDNLTNLAKSYEKSSKELNIGMSKFLNNRNTVISPTLVSATPFSKYINRTGLPSLGEVKMFRSNYGYT
jgi:hypothetical protein